jgi:hypothetical protein
VEFPDPGVVVTDESDLHAGQEEPLEAQRAVLPRLLDDPLCPAKILGTQSCPEGPLPDNPDAGFGLAQGIEEPFHPEPGEHIGPELGPEEDRPHFVERRRRPCGSARSAGARRADGVPPSGRR